MVLTHKLENLSRHWRGWNNCDRGQLDLSFVFCGQEQKAQHFLLCAGFQLTVYDRCADVWGFHHFSAAVLISRKGCPDNQTEALLCCI